VTSAARPVALAFAVATVACGGPHEASLVPVAVATGPAAPAQLVLPVLGRGGLGAVTGDTIFDPAAVATALPQLSWALHDGPNGERIIGTLDGRTAVAIGGWRFVETIDVLSSRLVTELGVQIDQPYDRALRARLPWCRDDVDAFGSPAHMQFDCDGSDGVAVHLDGDTTSASAAAIPDGRIVSSVHVRVSTGPRTAEAMARRPPAIAADPVVAASALRVDRDAIHPITDLAVVDAAALARALPHLDVAATANGFAISHAGAKVADIAVAAGKPTRIAILHPSVPRTFAIAIDVASGAADAPTRATLETAACTAGAGELVATCGLAELPRLGLAIAANLPLPPDFKLDGPFDDVRVTAIVWTPPRVPDPWPAIGDDAIGELTVAIATNADVLHARAALVRDFDVIGPGRSDIGVLAGYVRGVKVLELVKAGAVKVTLLDPRFVVAGTNVGPGSTVADAERAGLAPACAKQDDGDYCTTNRPRITLELRAGPGDGKRGFAPRTIASVVWAP
jgi:hypothetical protein